MFKSKNVIIHAIMLGILLISFSLSAGCQGNATSTGILPDTPPTTIVEDNAKDTTGEVAQQPAEPTDLPEAEGWQPYPIDFVLVGAADLKPGYEPMRSGVAAINPDLNDQLLKAGLKINTARTVVLAETVKPTVISGPENQSGVFSLVELKYEDINCAFTNDCSDVWVSEERDIFTLNETEGDGILFQLVRPPGEAGRVAQGLYGYEYEFSLANLIGKAPLNCIDSFEIDFGPVTQLDYDHNGTLDFGYAFAYPYAEKTAYGKPPVVEVNQNKLRLIFDPPVCAGTDANIVDQQGDLSFDFGFASIYPPRQVEWQMQDIYGTTYQGKYSNGLAPDYSREQFALAEVKNDEINCTFAIDCAKVGEVKGDNFTLNETGGYGFLDQLSRPLGDVGTDAQGLYGYEYVFDLVGLIGNTPLNCIHSFEVDFGPVTPLDYDHNGTLDLGYAYPYPFSDRPMRGKPPAVEVKQNTLRVLFDPPVCAGTDSYSKEYQGDLSYYFGFASIYPPRQIDWQLQDIYAVTYHGKYANGIAPDYIEEQPIEEQTAEAFTLVELERNDINISFSGNSSYIRQSRKMDTFAINETEGVGLLFQALRPLGDAGTMAQGLYGYEYVLDLRSMVGKPPLNCIDSFEIDFGPVTPLDYDQNGTLDLGYAYPYPDSDLPVRERLPVVDVKQNILRLHFDPPVCAGTDANTVEQRGERSYYFGFASKYPPRQADWQIWDVNGTMYHGKYANGLAPEYTEQEPMEEIVSIAPVMAAIDPNQFTEEQMTQMFQTEGVILGVLVLETNAPNSRIPSGTYLERAFIVGDKGWVELIDVTSGKTVLTLDLLSKKLDETSLIIPSAHIFMGTKSCLTCLWWGWYVCRDCFFWEEGMTFDECETIMNNLTASP